MSGQADPGTAIDPAAPRTVPLRFQRQELQQKSGMSDTGLACLATTTGPESLLATLVAMDNLPDAAAALALMLPRRQSVWWACLAARLIPNLDDRPAERIAVETAEGWVQSGTDDLAERALGAAQLCDPRAAAGWAAMAAHWSGASIAPRGQQPVPPAPHLTGVATRTALLFAVHDPALGGRIGYADLVAIGQDLMHGGLGRTVQATLRGRIANGA